MKTIFQTHLKNLIVSGGLSVLTSTTAHAFVENVRHGYVNCTSCHYSPSGGGLLTDYGRSLSLELLSRKGTENEAQALWGAAPPERPLKMGGHIRGIQTYRDTPQLKKGQAFLMQQELEVGWDAGGTGIVVNLGTLEGPAGTPNKGQAVSSQHYIFKNANDEILIRIGKFLLPFGINDPNHNRFTRADLGLQPGQETYNFDIKGTLTTWGYGFFAGLGRPDEPSLPTRRTVGGSVSYFPNDKTRIDLNLLLDDIYQTRKKMTGFNLAWGLAPSWILILEADHQKVESLATSSTTQAGWVGLSKINLEFTKGLWLSGVYEVSQLNQDQPSTQKVGYGTGLDFFPRPHFQLSLEFEKQRQGPPGEPWSDVAWGLIHVYL